MSVKTESIINNFIGAIKESKDKTTPYDTTAEVLRVDDDTVWVHIAGGVDETPIRKTINCNKGDNIQIRIGGGDAWIVGNATAPPTDDKKANIAHNIAINAEEKADDAFSLADNAYVLADTAKTIADDTNQYFWHKEEGTDTGAHITEYPQEEWEDSTNPNYHKGGNLLARSNGIAIRDGLTELSSFSASSAQIGVSGGGHTVIQSSGMDIYGGDGTKNLAHIGYDTANTESGTSSSPYYTFGHRLVAEYVYAYSSSKTYAVGDLAKYDGVTYVCKNAITTPEAWNSSNWVGLIGEYSLAEGDITVASGARSHAEGYNAVASGHNAHAEGGITVAAGLSSHAEGDNTIAGSAYQHVQGKNNVRDDNSTYADIVGWGTSSARKNIFALSTGGDGRYKGDVYVGCNDDSTGGTKLAKDVITTSSFTGNAIAFDSGTTWKDISSTTYPNNATASITDAGIYLLIGNVAFASNASGRRGIRWYDVTGDTAIMRSQQVFAPANGAIAYQQTICVVETTGTASYKLQAYQNSGSQLNVTPYVNVVRLK